MKAIPISQGNAFELRLKPVLTDGTEVLASALTNISVKMLAPAATTWTALTVTTDDAYIYASFASSLALGSYQVKLTAKLAGRDISANYGEIFKIVPVGMACPIDAVYGDLVCIGVNDADTAAYRTALSNAKDEYEAAAVEAEEARDAYVEAVEDLEDMAKQSTLENSTYGLQALKNAIDAIPGGGGGGGSFPTDYAKETTAQAAKTAAEGAKSAAEAISIPTDYAKESTASDAKTAAQSASALCTIIDGKLASRNAENEPVSVGAAVGGVALSIGADADGQPLHDKVDALADKVDGLSAGAPMVEMTATTATIEPNKLYVWGDVSALTITLAAPTDTTRMNEYMLQFYSGAMAATLTFTSEDVQVRGTISTNGIVCVSIVNNLALIG